MDLQSTNILKSQEYARAQVLDIDSQMKNQSPSKTKLNSPAKGAHGGRSPLKENSPLKKMGTLRKQSQLVEQENTESPLKTFEKGPSPQKGIRGKLLYKSISCDTNIAPRDTISSGKASPLKRQMRMFQAHESPSKLVSELCKAKEVNTEEQTEQRKSFLGQAKAKNLLKSRKTCERR